MKILWIGGNHPRHRFYVNTASSGHTLCGGIVLQREAFIPLPDPKLCEMDRLNFVRHFQDRADAEEKHFGAPDPPACPLFEVTAETLNSAASVEFVQRTQPDVVLLFGPGLIKDPLYSALPRHTVNLHLGLSPRYRGAATLFWPFYFLEPAYAGSTFHYIVGEPDAGDVIHQVVPPLDVTDGIHDVACKTVIASARDAVRLLEILHEQGSWKTHKQKSTGKNFLSSDFKPEHLRVIYNLFQNDMVCQYLEGKLEAKTPRLIRQF